jgi:hypothetical protein
MRLRPKRPILRAQLGRRPATLAEIAYLRSVVPTARSEQCQVVYYGGQAYICCGAAGVCVPLPILGPGDVDLYGRPMRFTNPAGPVNMRSGAVWRNQAPTETMSFSMQPVRSGSAYKPMSLAAALPSRPGEICWWTGSPADAKCCSYEGMQLPICVTYPDVE